MTCPLLYLTGQDERGSTHSSLARRGFSHWQELSIPALMRLKLTLKDFTSLTKRTDDLCEKAGRFCWLGLTIRRDEGGFDTVRVSYSQ